MEDDGIFAIVFQREGVFADRALRCPVEGIASRVQLKAVSVGVIFVVQIIGRSGYVVKAEIHIDVAVTQRDEAVYPVVVPEALLVAIIVGPADQFILAHVKAAALPGIPCFARNPFSV